MHEPQLPRRQPPSLGTSHATPIRNTPADGSSENEGKFGALAPGEGRAPPTKKRPTATNRLHQFSASLSSHVQNDGHECCLQQRHPSVHSAGVIEQMFLGPGSDVVPWSGSWVPVFPHPPSEIFPTQDAPTCEDTTQRRPTQHHGLGHCHVVLVEMHWVFDTL